MNMHDLPKCTSQLDNRDAALRTKLFFLVQYLERHGIRPILNYAAEDDVNNEFGCEGCPVAAAERKLDRNLDIFMRSIRDSDNIRNRAFVAIKVRSPESAMCLLATSDSQVPRLEPIQVAKAT